jgi:dipeptidyl aminopeptidase/acylaminoacyl peptidase
MPSMSTIKRTLTIDDVARIKNIAEVHLSPDGERAVFAVKSMNLEKNKFDSDIYIASTSGGEAFKLTDDGNSSLPEWSPDGRRIAFAQNVEGKRSIWLMDSGGKNRRKITDYDLSNAFLEYFFTVGELIRWSPDGSMMAFLASVGPVEKEAKIKVITRLMYKSFYGYSDMRRRHIFVVSPLGQEPPRQLTFGDFDEYSICWSPDSREIAFVSNRTGFDDFNMHTDIWAVNVGSGEIRRITDTKGAEYNPKWSPDGKMIAYAARTRANTSNESTPEDTHVWVVNSDGSQARDLTSGLDRPCYDPPHWTPDGSRILFTAPDRGRTHIYSVSPEGGSVTRVTNGDRCIGRISLAKEKDRMAYVSNNPTNPDELFSARLNGDNEIKLTSLNGFLEDVYLSWPEEFTFKSFDGTDIQGWILKPRDLKPAEKYPTLLNIKGGPSGMRGYDFNTHLQVGPAYGYVQIHVNYRGCSGYGQAFSDAIVGDMLGGEFRDNMEAVDYIVKTRSYVDADRMGVWGVSYGGYLTNWVVTQTDRFKAAVPISSISNLWSDWGTSVAPLWVEVEIEGLPWDRMELMLRQSPIMQANKVKTPVLFLQGEMDFDTPIIEAEQMFTALKKCGVETVMVRYVDDGHGIHEKPINQLDALRRVIEWFDRHLKQSVTST